MNARRYSANFWHWRTIRMLRRRVRKYRNFANFYKNQVISGGGSQAGFDLLNRSHAAARSASHLEQPRIAEAAGPDPVGGIELGPFMTPVMKRTRLGPPSVTRGGMDDDE